MTEAIKRSRIDFDKGFDINDPDLLRTQPHTSPVINTESKEAIQTAMLAEQPDIPYHPQQRSRSKMKAKRQTDTGLMLNIPMKHEIGNGQVIKRAMSTKVKGIWGSGLSVSAQLGVRDSNEASWTQVVEVLEFMSDASDVPILLDADTGYGNFNNARRLVRKLEDRGVAGADAILMHSKKADPSDIEAFMKAWNNQIVSVKEIFRLQRDDELVKLKTNIYQKLNKKSWC
ncbi:pepM [Mytilus edulis]|uniref:PepM n=1 Tax=Mytilus edulis TaxID=6550 RepID=A0A8S3TNF9_MYTED|nr:pepM [Mytilus edulis]